MSTNRIICNFPEMKIRFAVSDAGQALDIETVELINNGRTTHSCSCSVCVCASAYRSRFAFNVTPDQSYSVIIPIFILFYGIRGLILYYIPICDKHSRAVGDALRECFISITTNIDSSPCKR